MRTKRTQAAILDAALRRFAADGFRGTSIASIAADAEMTDAGVLYHYKTKEGLLLRVLEDVDAAERAEIDSLLDGAVEGIDALRRLIDWGAVMERDELATSLIAMLSTEHMLDDSRVHDYFVGRYERAVERVATLVRQAQAAGEIAATVDAETEARLVVAMLDGVRLQYFYSQGDVSMERLVRHYGEQLLERWTERT